MRSLLIALAVGVLLFAVSSSFAFDYSESRMTGWIVGLVMFPGLPLIWQLSSRRPPDDEFTRSTRFAMRVAVIAILALGVALLIGRERVARATTSHGWWWFPAASPPPPQPPPPPPPVKKIPPPPPPVHVARVDASYRNVCAVTDAGLVDCWGFGENGQSGQNKDLTVPTRVAGVEHVASVAIGQTNVCALLRDSSVQCWGDGATVPKLINVRQLGAGDGSFCALLADGTVKCWGDNTDGELGDGTKTARVLPVQVRGLANVAQIAVGGRHVCARTAAGTVSCWGGNEFAQLGSPGRAIHNPATQPLAVKGLVGVVDLAAGQNHTCARVATGEVSCWGWDEDGGSPCHAAPLVVAGLTDVAELALSSMHSCARHTNGEVVCWGDDPKQFLPDNSSDSKVPRSCVPIATEVHTAAQIAVFWTGVCALLADNSISCWGSNAFGQLGDGTTAGRPHPARIKSM